MGGLCDAGGGEGKGGGRAGGKDEFFVRIIVVRKLKATREDHDSTALSCPCIVNACLCPLQLGGPCKCFGCGGKGKEEGLLQ